MHLGVQLAHLGPLADAAAVRTAATSADVLGYHSLWAVDPRLLAAPSMPPIDGLDPITALACAAAVTEHVWLGAHLRVGPFDTTAATVDALDALGTDRLVVAIDLDDGHHGPPGAGRSEPLLAAFRRPGRPLLVSSRMTEQAAARIVHSADGWMAMRLAPAEIGGAWRSVGDAAHRAGRDVAELRLVVRVDATLTERPLGQHRSTYCGSVEQVVDDLVALVAAGASEAVLALPGEHHLDVLLGAYAAIAEGLELRTPS